MTIPIGELSLLASVKVPTIRYYEDIGLMPRPARTSSNRRVYDDDAVRRLRFIRHARDLGFEVDAIHELLTLADRPDESCREADGIAMRHLQAINGKIARLSALRDEVARMTRECAHGAVADCRVIEVLADHGECLSETH